MAKAKKSKKASPKPKKVVAKKAKPAAKPVVKSVAKNVVAKIVVAKSTTLATKKKVPKPESSAALPREDSVDEYLTKVAPWQRAVIEKLRALVKTTAPHVSEVYKWGQPVYEHKGPFAYVKAHAAQVNFGFWRGADLDDPKRMLQGEGASMRHVKIMEAQAIDEEVLAIFVKHAVSLNDKKGDPTKG